MGRTFCAHLSLAFQITLVSDDNDGEVVLVLDAQDLLLECDDLLEALTRCYAVNEKEALACSHVLLAHGTVQELCQLGDNSGSVDLTRIPLGQQYPRRRAALLHHLSHTAYDTNLYMEW